MKRMSFAQRTQLRRSYIVQNPRWRHPLVGYLLCPFIVALGMAGTLFLQKALGTLHFPASFLILTVLFSALFWGVGPALVAVILSAVLIDYYFIPPVGQIALNTWDEASQLLTFIISGLTIAVITAQRERAHLRVLATEQELQSYAEELEATNRKLEEANETKDRFISIASHELKTPVTTIRGQAQLTIRRLSKQKDLSPEMETIGAALHKINDQTTRLTGLIDELMDVSSIRAGKVQLRKQKCDLKDICREVVEDQRLLSGRVITLEVPSIPVKMQVDCERLAQVFVNLISNAVKYSPEESPIEVIVGKQDHTALVQVKDHGRGIPKDHQEHIFETFYRTPDAQSSSKRGLGLAISEDIVERHEGRIWCESAPGKGSTFSVELPLR